MIGGTYTWLQRRGVGDRNGKGFDGESPDDEESESSFGEHDDMECREGEQIRTAPGPKFERQERGTR